MPDDPYFNQIGMHLMSIPAASRTHLEAAARGTPPPVPPNAQFSLTSAKSWVKELLQDAYHPPDDTPFVAFPLENDLCDVIRAVYKVRGSEIEIAQSRYLISVTVRGFRGAAGATGKARAEEVARQLFTLGNAMHFEKAGSFRSGVWGKQGTSPSGPIDRDWPHWADKIRWWTDALDVGFITLKAAGGPTKAPIAPIEAMNKNWFG
ncbi:MAG: hypothetical protein HOP18_25855 [Deltaproteobacteria bacterium]|nr:hypothetical protein [Deltaproteobacteria bacterium]